MQLWRLWQARDESTNFKLVQTIYFQLSKRRPAFYTAKPGNAETSQ